MSSFAGVSDARVSSRETSPPPSRQVVRHSTPSSGTATGDIWRPSPQATMAVAAPQAPSWGPAWSEGIDEPPMLPEPLQCLRAAVRAGGGRTCLLSGQMLYSLPTPLPQEELANLRMLDLSDNALGELAPSIGSLKRLKCLLLQSNVLHSLPEALADLRRLETLNLSVNFFTTLPAVLQHLTSLRNLYLSGNDFGAADSLAPAILPVGLTRLALAGCKLEKVDHAIEHLSALEELSLARNAIPKVPAVLDRLPALRDVTLARNQIAAWWPPSMGLQRLECLNLSNNCFTVFPAAVLFLPALKTLYLGPNFQPALPAYYTLLGCGQSGGLQIKI